MAVVLEACLCVCSDLGAVPRQALGVQGFPHQNLNTAWHNTMSATAYLQWQTRRR